MPERLAILGIDSLDPDILLHHRAVLPNFSQLMSRSPTFRSRSIFPPDTIPAWVSIFTGLQPANHGILYSYDMFDSGLEELRNLRIDRIRGTTFWDIAGKRGLRSVVIFPQGIFPGWEIPGVMICKSPVDVRKDRCRTEADIEVHPDDAQEKYGIPRHYNGLWGGYPGGRLLEEWSDIGLCILERERKWGLSLLENEPWDLFFIYISVLDIIQHRLWRFYDPADPTYPGANTLGGIIPHFYKAVDTVVGDFLAAAPEATFLVLSDHGHGMRPPRTVNINEVLRLNGHLICTPWAGITEGRIRNTILGLAQQFGLEESLMTLVMMSPSISREGKSLYSGQGGINRQRSRAYLSHFAGIKSYPHGGIEINREVVSDQDYDKLRDAIIHLLSSLRTPEDQPQFEFVEKREEIFPGPHTPMIFPDIVFRLGGGYGVGWEMYRGIYGQATDHRLASGGHAQNAVFLLHGTKDPVQKREISILDVAPTILDHYGIPWQDLHLDGKSIFGSD